MPSSNRVTDVEKVSNTKNDMLVEKLNNNTLAQKKK